MKESTVVFVSNKLKKAYKTLETGKFEDKQLFEFLNKAFDELKEDHENGIKIPKKLWPKDYKKYELTNLWKYNLPNAWRLIYTVDETEIMIMSIVLEWLNHKDYNKRFKY